MSCQANDSVVAVLEKVASLNDQEEVARLAEEAKGRKFFLRNISHYLSFLLPVFNSMFNLMRCAMP